MKNVIIFGGAGFVGGHLTKFLSKKGYETTPVDVVQKQEVMIGDIRRQTDCNKFCKHADIVIHLAGELPHAGWQKELPKGSMWNIMVNGTKNVLEACLENNVKKVVYYSSSAVYGNPPPYVLKEDAPHAPLDEYGKAKSRAENICKEYMVKGLNITIIRPMTILGPNFVGILRSMMEFIYQGKRLFILGDGSNRIQLVHIDDVVDATITCIKKSKSKNEVFNIASNNPPTVREELEELCRYADTGSKPTSLPPNLTRTFLMFTRVIGKATMGKEIYTLADKTFLVSTKKAEKLLGWKARYNNIDALKAGYDWFSREHEIARPDLSIWLKLAMWIG